MFYKLFEWRGGHGMLVLVNFTGAISGRTIPSGSKAL